MSRALTRRALLGLPGFLPFLETHWSRAEAAAEAGVASSKAPFSLVTFAAAEDTFALAGCSHALPGRAWDTLTEHHEAASALAGVWRSPAEPLAELDAAARGTRADPRLAAALMWLVHDSAQAVLAPPAPDAAERNLYRDGALVRDWSAPAEATPPEATVILDALLTLERRLFVRVHTIEPDSEDPAGWIEKLIDWRLQRSAWLESLARVTASPDPGLWARHVNGTPPLYADRDPLLHLLRAARSGDRLSSADVKARIELPSHALYAQAVRAAFARLQAASHYVEGRGPRAALVTR